MSSTQDRLADPETMAQWIWDAADKLNYPSAHALYTYLKSHNQYVPYKVISEAYTQNQPERQIFYRARLQSTRPKHSGPITYRPPNLKQGKVAAADINDRWMVDLVDLTAQPSAETNATLSSSPFHYILVVLNVFSKQLWAKALRSKVPSVVTEAFKEILRGKRAPSRIDTDAGPEFAGPFARLMEDLDVFHVVKDTREANALAPLDRAIGTLKRAIFRRVVADEDGDWASSLQKTVDGYNETVHSALQGRTPNEVPDDPELQFALRRFNSEAMVHNANVIHARDEKLVKQGAFRVQDPRRVFTRSYQPLYGNKVHEVVHAQGGIVLDTDGNVHKSKFTLPVPGGSEPVSIASTAGMRGGSALIERRNLAALEPYRGQITSFVAEGNRIEFQVADFMKSIGMAPLIKGGLNYRKALNLLGFNVDGRGFVTAQNRESAPVAAAPAVPVVPQRGLIRITGKRPPLTPAEAATNLRRRITGKRPG